MSGKGNLAALADVVYVYDGSFDGFLCCVYESVYSHEIPQIIYPVGEAQPSLYDLKQIETEPNRAKRVLMSIPPKMGKRALELLKTVFLSGMQQKELALLRFLLLGYKVGAKVIDMMGHPLVAPVLAAEKHVNGECHLLLGFVRFSDYDGVLAATITPKSFALPFIANHFVMRYPNEDFLIFDKTHKAALVYQDKQQKIIPLENIEFPEADETELGYRKLWKQFYNTIAIEARYNPKCRMTHMPKRYWENMTEMQDFL